MTKPRQARSETFATDLLVIGGGLSGVFAALKAKESGIKKVTLVSKGRLGKDSISTFAAGVSTLVLPTDDKEALFKMYALGEASAAGVYDADWLQVWIDEMYERTVEMDKWGVAWQKTPDGQFERKGMRGGEMRAMFPGPQMMEAMAKKVRAAKIEVIGHTMITDLLTENGKPEGRVVGAVGFEVRTGTFRVFKAKCTVLAAGPCGFKGRFAGHKFQTGESYAMGYRAGAVMGLFERGTDFQLTANAFDTQGMNMFIALGGYFVNAAGERFMLYYDEKFKDSSSLAIVSAASAMEVRAGRGPIYLDMTHLTPESIKKLKSVLPLPTKILERAGVLVGDKITRRIEFSPAYWGTTSRGGGLVTNTKCETSLAGLFCCGDAMARSASGPRGLPGVAVSGARAGIFAAEYAKAAKAYPVDKKQVQDLKAAMYAPMKAKDGIEPEHVILGVQEVIMPYDTCIVSRRDRLEKAIAEIERIQNEEIPMLYASDAHYLRLANEAKSMTLTAEMVLRSRLLREESRGSCLREDYPYTDNVNWLKNTRLKEEGGRMWLWTEDLPVESYKVLPEKGKYLHPILEGANKRGVKWG